MTPHVFIPLGEVIIVAPPEDIDDEGVERLISKITSEAKARETKRIVVDLSSVEVVDTYLARRIERLAHTLMPLDTSRSSSPGFPCQQGHGTVICATLRPGNERSGTRPTGWPGLAGIVAPRPSGGRCGDWILVQTDGRYLRVTVLDAEGTGIGHGKEGQLMVQNLDRLALLWPPDRVLDLLKRSCLPGQPSARILLVDLLSGSVQSAGMGNVRLVLHARQEAGQTPGPVS